MINELKNCIKYGKTLPRRLDDVIDYYRDNPNVDPNIFEFMTLACDVSNAVYSNYGLEDYYCVLNGECSCEYYDKINILGSLVKERLLSNKICSEENILYNLVDEMIDYSCSFNKVTKEQKTAFEQVGGILLFIKQKERFYRSFMRPYDILKETGYKYSNKEEFNQLCETMKTAQKDNIKRGNINPIMFTREDAFDEIKKYLDYKIELENNTEKKLKLTK